MKNKENIKLRAKNFDKLNLKSHLKTKYDLTIDEYNILLENQGNRCAICNKHRSSFNERLAVDHCHETLQVRGLLCRRCNVGIGMFFEEEELLIGALMYINKINENKRIFKLKQ